MCMYNIMLFYNINFNYFSVHFSSFLTRDIKSKTCHFNDPYQNFIILFHTNHPLHTNWSSLHSLHILLQRWNRLSVGHQLPLRCHPAPQCQPHPCEEKLNILYKGFLLTRSTGAGAFATYEKHTTNTASDMNR